MGARFAPYSLVQYIIMHGKGRNDKESYKHKSGKNQINKTISYL